MTDGSPVNPAGRPKRVAPAPDLRLHSGSRRLAVAWLLRTRRWFAGDADFARIASFAAAFPGGHWNRAADQSKISRWETGGVQVPYLAVRRYEQLLGLDEHSMVAVIDALNRYFAPHDDCRPGLVRPPVAWDLARHERIADLLDRAHSGAILTGVDWDELTGFLAVTPEAVLPRPGTWAELAERLLLEMVIADGLAWMQRFEAFCRLIAHPVGQRATIAACAALAADPTNQAFVDTLSVLEASTHPDASRHVLRQLRTPTNDEAFTGALLACVRKSQRRHFSPDEATALAGRLWELATDPGTEDETQRLAVTVLEELRRTADLPFTDQLPRYVREPQPAGVAPVLGNAVVARIMIAVQTAGRRDGADMSDEMLPVLLDEMLFDPVVDVRLYTGMLLRASPYRAAVADALVAELRSARARHDTDLMLTIVAALRAVGTDRHAPTVRRLVLAPGVPEAVRVRAAYSVGHLQTAATDPFWDRAVGYHLRQWAGQRDQTSAGVLTGLVYGLGVTGDELLLRRVQQAEVPAPLRQSATWWLNLPGYVRASARL